MVDDQVNTSLMETFREDYDALNDNPSRLYEDLVVRTFCPLNSTMGAASTGSWKYAIITAIWSLQKSKDDFIKVVKPLMEKILGVKTFFDQYQVKERGCSRSF